MKVTTLTTPMPVPPMARPVLQVKFRLTHVIRNWTDATELVRQAAAETGYIGPSVEEMEQVGRNIAQVRAKLHSWVWNTAAKEARGLHPRDRDAVREVIKVYPSPVDHVAPPHAGGHRPISLAVAGIEVAVFVARLAGPRRCPLAHPMRLDRREQGDIGGLVLGPAHGVFMGLIRSSRSGTTAGRSPRGYRQSSAGDRVGLTRQGRVRSSRWPRGRARTDAGAEARWADPPLAGHTAGVGRFVRDPSG